MCGFVKRDLSEQALGEFLKGLGWQTLQDEGLRAGSWHFYPAFGARPERQIHGLIIANPSEAIEGDPCEIGRREAPTVVDATWWYDCKAQGDTLQVGRRTTFNARNLDSPFWRPALRHHRALVLATAFGETQTVNGRKVHYLMSSAQPFFLGALYRRYNNGCCSCAVVTKNPTEAFKRFHEKAAPFIIPNDRSLLLDWLNPKLKVDEHPKLASLLYKPVLPIELSVTPVQTFKGGHAKGATERLSPNFTGD